MNVATIKNDVQELYIGILGRAADYAGLTYWVNQIAKGNLTLADVRKGFTEQQEYTSVYQGLSPTNLVKKIYQNVLNREPDVDGLAYWVGELQGENPISEDALIEAIMNGAKGQPVDAQVLANKVQVADEFTTKNSAKKVNDNFSKAAESVLQSINNNQDSVKEALLLSATLSNLLEDSFIFREDFEGASLGFYNDQQLQADVSSFSDSVNLTGPAEVVSDLDNQSLLLTLEANQTKSGYQRYEHFEDQQVAYFSYDITYLPGYEWTNGVKGPGLGASLPNHLETIKHPTGNRDVDADQGFSLRSMTQKDGSMYLYVYDQRKDGEGAGEYIALTLNGEPVTMEIGKTYTITQKVVMNTPGKEDGSVTMTVDGQTVLELTDRVWSESGEYGINTLFVDFWNGGKGENFEPSVDSKIMIDNLAVSTAPILAHMFEELISDAALQQYLLAEQIAANQEITDILSNDVGLSDLHTELDNSGVNTLLPSVDDFF